jgi:hypothetical protein
MAMLCRISEENLQKIHRKLEGNLQKTCRNSAGNLQRFFRKSAEIRREIHRIFALNFGYNLC